MTTPPPPHGQIQAWQLNHHTGKTIWARPYGAPETRPPEWVRLNNTWVEKDEHNTYIVAHINWDGTTATALYLPTNTIQVELGEHDQVDDNGRIIDDWTRRPPPMDIRPHVRRPPKYQSINTPAPKAEQFALFEAT